MSATSSLGQALRRSERRAVQHVRHLRFGIPFLDFFAGSGLVTEALKDYFRCIWANDICPKKQAVYAANHGAREFVLGSIHDVSGHRLPPSVLSWASFPCQDLSLAGNLGGISSSRSGLVWQWLRIMDEMPVRPPILVAENVPGLISAANGSHYHELHSALTDRGYQVGPLLLDAVYWVPQSRPRVFVVAVAAGVDVGGFVSNAPQWCHSNPLVRTVFGIPGLVWWTLPKPEAPPVALEALVQFDAPVDPPEKTRRVLSLITARHRVQLERAIAGGQRAFPAYKRTRAGQQVLELRFDGVAGCLRTAHGGSSRQFLVISTEAGLTTRLLTVRETARLMGAPDSYRLPGSYNEAYSAMGDAVVVPVVRYLAAHLLNPLAVRAMEGTDGFRTSASA